MRRTVMQPECCNDAVTCWSAVGGAELDNAVLYWTDNVLVESIQVHL